MHKNYNHIALLDYINPAGLSYQEWLNVGMALKKEGYNCTDWDMWSRQDISRYKSGECQRKWNGFNGDGITGGTIYQIAAEHGWSPAKTSHALDWDDEIDGDYQIVDPTWVESKEITEPAAWQPARELITYIETLFDSTENVGYVTSVWEKDGEYMPTKGNYDRTAGQLIEELSKCNGDIGAVIGDYKKEAGAWIRFNPLDGKGVKNENVTDFRYTLIESDTQDIAKQNAIIRELELPVACLVHSGKKSIHAIVRVDAKDFTEYRKRVDYIYTICKKNGLDVDGQNKNPSRLSRMPGIMRNEHKQFLIATNIGKASYDEWYDFIEDLSDDLPDPEALDVFWDDMPELAPELIHGVLRQGHKLLITGPSKAGKSFALIELSIAIAEGRKWLNWDCAQGRVLYVNLELDRASCLHRFKDVYTALDIAPSNISNIDIWNLRGNAVPMDILAPKLIRRADKRKYIAVIIDPIYKVLTGDENSADQMAHFVNQFDRIASELNCSVIYCHHHSKGTQAGKKSLDRASGSGVFARDPDALLDFMEIDLTEEAITFAVNRAKCAVYDNIIKKYHSFYHREQIGIDDLYSLPQMSDHAIKALNEKQLSECIKLADAEEVRVKRNTAWKIEGTLREFAKFDPVNMYFTYPIHKVDSDGILADIESSAQKPLWQKGRDARKKQAEKSRKEVIKEFEMAIENASFGEPPTKEEVAEMLGVSIKTVERRLGESAKYYFDKPSAKIQKVIDTTKT